MPTRIHPAMTTHSTVRLLRTDIIPLLWVWSDDAPASRSETPTSLPWPLCFTCWSAVVPPTAVVFLVHILHVTHQLAILLQPRTPRLPGLRERPWLIVHLPDALIDLC